MFVRRRLKKGSVSVCWDLPENPVDRNDAPVAAVVAVVVVAIAAAAAAAVSVSAVVVAAAGDADNNVAQFSRK